MTRSASGTGSFSRRSLLKRAAAGGAAAATASWGFPTVWAQNAKDVPLVTKGSYPNGTMASTQGLAPIEAMFYEGADGKKLASKPTEFLTMLPTIYNADTLGIRPDLVGGRDKVASWKDLLDPKYKGKTALVDYAPVGVIDVAMALEARGDFKYKDKGNMTKEEIDKTIKIMIDLKK